MGFGEWLTDLTKHSSCMQIGQVACDVLQITYHLGLNSVKVKAAKFQNNFVDPISRKHLLHSIVLLCCKTEQKLTLDVVISRKLLFLFFAAQKKLQHVSDICFLMCTGDVFSGLQPTKAPLRIKALGLN